MDVPDLALIPGRRRCAAALLRFVTRTFHLHCTGPDRQVAPPHRCAPEGPRLMLESRRVAITITEWPAPPLAALQSFVLAAVTILQIPRMFCLHSGNKPRKNVASW